MFRFQGPNFSFEWDGAGGVAIPDAGAGAARYVSDAGDADVEVADESVIVIDKDIAETTRVHCPPAASRNGRTLIVKDGKGLASVAHPIVIGCASGEFADVTMPEVPIIQPFACVWLLPRPTGGWLILKVG